MNKLLNDYYNMDINEFYYISDGYIFYVDTELYYLYKLESEIDIEFINDIKEYVKKYYIRLHDIVLNIFNEYISDGYVLMKVNVLMCDIGYDDVYLFNNCIMEKYKDKYIGLRKYWFDFIDNMERGIINYNSDIKYDFYYYIGIVERLLNYITDVDNSKYKLVLGHKKRSKNSIDFFNPFNVCIDFEYNNLVYYLVSNGEMEHIFDYIDIKDIYVRKYIIFYLLFPFNFFENLNEYVSDVKLYEVHVSKVLEMFGFKKRSD